MRRLKLIIASFISPLIIWLLSLFCFFQYYDNEILIKILGKSYYTSFGKAARPYIHYYFLTVIIIAIVLAVTVNKFLNLKSPTYILFVVLISIIIYFIIAYNIIGRYGFLV